MEYNIYLVDSFTDQNFKGNPAGVVPDARRLSEKEMQAIARELNASETAFITSNDRELYKMRFFSPYKEISFCGHSTLATCYILARKGYITSIESGIKSVYILLNNKRLEVEIYFYNYEIESIILKLGTPLDYGVIKEDAELLDALNLEIENINFNSKFKEIPIIDFGYKYAFIPIKEKDKLDNIDINKRNLRKVLERNDLEGIHLFYLEEKNSRFVYTRSFSDKNNLNEDPATVTANGSLIYLLKKKELIDADTIIAIQGDNIGRRSNLFCHIKGKEGNYRVDIGGKGKVVLEGIINVE